MMDFLKSALKNLILALIGLTVFFLTGAVYYTIAYIASGFKHASEWSKQVGNMWGVVAALSFFVIFLSLFDRKKK